jgi:hypothetical protein
MTSRVIFCPKCNERIEEKLKIEKEKLLIVEGRDEEEFFGALLENLEIYDIQVAAVGGKTKIKPNLKALKITDPMFDRITSLGIIRDADDNHQNAFRSIQDALNAADLPCPKRPLISTKSSPKVSVMILPPGVSRGALEDVCLGSVQTDPAISCVDAYFDCLDANGNGRPEKDFNKAKTRVFLSSRKEPTLKLGEGAKKGYWPFNAVEFDGLKKFLGSL